MKTTARARANRANARRSTGPRSRLGKQRVARNAFRHELAVPVAALHEFDSEVTRLALLLAGADAAPDRLDLAHRVAEAQIDLQRVRAAKLTLLATKVGDPTYQKPVPMALLRMRLRIAKITYRHVGDLPSLEELQRPAEADCYPVAGPERVAAILADLAKAMMRLDRYERRALSRRKAAVRALDALPAKPVRRPTDSTSVDAIIG